MTLPPLMAVLVTAGAALLALGALGIALTRGSLGIGHAVAGLVTAVVGLLLVATSAALPRLGIDAEILGDDGGDLGPVLPWSEPTVEPIPSPAPVGEPVALRPADVQASATADPSRDGAGDLVTFVPWNVADGDPETTWRVPGDGVGQYLELTFDVPVYVDSIAVVPGYAKVDPTDGTDRFRQNRRVSSAVFHFSGGEELQVSYADAPQWQTVTARVATEQVVMEITSTTSGERDFTAVADVEVTGWVLG
ncbi:NADase-type glycan-binding domain-containing protein [Geodermatophilus maliterrae]|uniref:NAD glycohydrolase translocation F5/8 type C domain-containing protein n=1 Tax=Geodermatophilus maliterrae TaxID=3162531 RepID=A0ABV3XDW1_9ACTN